MNLLSGCPERGVLEQFQLRQLSVAEIELISRHMDQCGRCLVVLHELTAGDTLPGTASSVDITPAPRHDVRDIGEREGQRGSQDAIPVEVPRIAVGIETTLDQPMRPVDREQAERSALPQVPGYEILALLG